MSNENDYAIREGALSIDPDAPLDPYEATAISLSEILAKLECLANSNNFKLEEL